MKIAIDIRTAGGEKAGKGWYTFHIVRSLLKQDSHNEYLLYTKDQIAGFHEFKNAQVKTISGGYFSWHWKVASDCRNENVDIFFAPTSYITPIFLSSNIHIILTVHDLVAFLFPNRHNKKATILERLFLRFALKKSDHVLTVSNNTKQDLLNRFNYAEEKITVVSCAASDDFHPIARQELAGFIEKTNLPQKFFLAVGTIEPRKNYPNLIRAFALVHEKFPDYELIIVGKNGWDYEEVYDLVRENYLQKKVHFLGYLSNKSLVSLYNLATSLVFPSFYEGFGMPLLEAMKCGCPVIASYTSSIPEVVGESALLVNPEGETDIANAMIRVIKDEELRKKLSSRGLEQAKKFSWNESGKKLNSMFFFRSI